MNTHDSHHTHAHTDTNTCLHSHTFTHEHRGIHTHGHLQTSHTKQQNVDLLNGWSRDWCERGRSVHSEHGYFLTCMRTWLLNTVH